MDFSLASEPEKIIGGVRHRLATHALWQSVLFFLPPLIALYYMIFFLHRFDWLDPDAVLIAGASLLIVASLSAVARFRSLVPSERSIARLIDDKSEGEDRFVTLATIDPMASPPALLWRLRQEAASLHSRIEFKRDFPFRVNRSFLNSCIASLIAIVLFHLSLELAPLLNPDTRGKDLALVGEELSRHPGLEKLAERLKALAPHLQDPAISDEEKRSLIKELRQQINQQLAGSQASGTSDQLLRQAGKQLSGLEEGLGSGQGRGKGGGGSQDSSKEQRGEGRGAAESGKADKQSGEVPNPSPSEAEKNISDATKPTGQRQEKQAGELRGTERAEGKDGLQDKGSGLDGGSKENLEFKGGTGPEDGKSPDTTPERSLRPGDHGEALKNSRFITVQLPEEQTASRTGDGKGKSAVPKSPVGNLPLARPDPSNAAAEKQMLPLEYRGMIR